MYHDSCFTIHEVRSARRGLAPFHRVTPAEPEEDARPCAWIPPTDHLLCREAMAQRSIKWSLLLVGGMYDGTRGLVWNDDGEHPVPDTILVGVCPGDGLCVGDKKLCRQLGLGSSHVAYWLPDEEEDERAEVTTTYEKETDHVERRDDGTFDGVARYVVTGLGLPGAEAISERVLVPA